MRGSYSAVISGLAIAFVAIFLYHPVLPLFGGPHARLIYDSVDFSYPIAVFVSRCFRHLVFPMWNPFSFSGTQFLGNLQSLILNPLTALAGLVAPLTLTRFQALQVAQVTVGAVGFFWWGLVRTESRVAGVVTAILFLGCGMVVNFFSHYILLSLYCLLPYPFAAFTVWERTGRVRWLAVTVIALVSWMFTSYPSQLGNYCIAFAIFYLVRRWRWLRHGRGWRRLAPELLALALLPAMVAAIHLVPSLLMISRLDRPVGLKFEDTFLGTLHAEQLATLMLGGLATAKNQFAIPDITLRDMSVGVTGLFLIALALTRPRRGRWLLLLAALACIDLMLGANSLLMPLVFRISPFSRNSKFPIVEFGSLLSFILLTLAIEGVGDLVWRPAKWRLDIALVAVVIFWVVAWQVAATSWAPLTADVRRWDSMVVIEPVISLLIMVAVAAAARLRVLRSPAVAVTLVVAAFLDSSRNVDENRDIVYETTPPTTFMAKADEYAKVDATYFDLETRWPRQHTYPVYSSAGMISGTRYDWGYDSMVFPAQIAAIKKPSARAVILNPAPIFVASEVTVAPDPSSVALLQGDRRVVALDRPATAATLVDPHRVNVEVARYGINDAEYTVRSPAGPTIVVLNELAMPGWRAQVDGEAAEIRTANGFFRALELPAGDHHLRFWFRPPGFHVGLFLTIIGLLILGPILWASRRTLLGQAPPPAG